MNPGIPTGPVPLVDPRLAYRKPGVPGTVRLRLDANEGATPSIEAVLDALRLGGPELVRRYPDTRAFEAMLAARYGLDPDQAFVTAGADEGIDRCCRAFLGAGRSMLLTDPTFEMFERYATLTGGAVERVRWAPGPFPADAMLAAIDDRVSIVAVVTPNNPTGEVATIEDLRRIASAAPRALVILDHAYAEYADRDLTAEALALPNVVVIRTFSKAWGLAGCRVGYTLGRAAILAALRAAGGPFPVAATSLAIVTAHLERGTAGRDGHVARIREERLRLQGQLARRGASPRTSQANFVYAELGPRAADVHAALREQGILVRLLRDRSGAPHGLRITLPGDEGQFALLTSALDVALATTDRAR